ncbi:kinesin-like protein KIN-14O [Iris pallida]|uniref:Kinesin-like protein KIN-14O n=1 Tax=Iris pallida TaxID=29817 RepID=A0AAX6I8H3_IRIPA|nr:kinesin-like protein KIN-14O [Iris pallida]KAJ6849522.1 kinesin-like protein KIN-14O [Iris pallida]
MFVLVSFSVPHVSTLRLKQRSLYTQRTDALNKILNIKGSIRVFCRSGSRSNQSEEQRRSSLLIGCLLRKQHKSKFSMRWS